MSSMSIGIGTKTSGSPSKEAAFKFGHALSPFYLNYIITYGSITHTMSINVMEYGRVVGCGLI